MDFELITASADDSQLFADIIQAVWEELENKEWFMADNADYTHKMLSGGMGRGYMAIDAESGQTAGVFMATVPGMSEENLGRDAGLPEEDLLLAAHMDSIAVLPRFRGHGLQYRLMQKAEADLRTEGFRYLLCTVHPDNHHSLDNVLRQGYQIMTVKEKYGGRIRAVLMKTLLD